MIGWPEQLRKEGSVYKYHKIQSLYKRNPETHRFDGRWSMEEFGALQEIEWEWTEKLDGMNIRIGFDPYVGDVLLVGGRTDKAEIPGRLRAAIESVGFLSYLKDASILWNDAPVTLIGEGIGSKIQRGADYHLGEPKNEFVLFDVNVGSRWLNRVNVEETARVLGIRSTPVIGTGTLLQAEEFVREGFASMLEGSAKAAEGLVVRPPVEMFGQWGQRIIAKVKTKDFA